jgi:hypothetical protein
MGRSRAKTSHSYRVRVLSTKRMEKTAGLSAMARLGDKFNANKRTNCPFEFRLGTSFQCHYMVLWNCSHASCEVQMDHLRWSHYCRNGSFSCCTFISEAGGEEARAPMRGVGAAPAPLHVVCDPPTGRLFQPCDYRRRACCSYLASSP